jgi:magnesium chelatase subunit I
MLTILTYRHAMTRLAPPVPADLPRTLGELRSSGYESRTVKEEMRANLIARLAAGDPTLPGIVGFDETVVPQVERALLAGHDIVLLGERGQGKTRLIRTLVGLLDEWMPVVEGSEVNDDPLAPVSAYGRRVVDELGDATPVTWKHRSERYGEKLATPDTSVGDLVGDVDPVKVAEGRVLGDPETIHFGLVPRTNRGIFAINELPDLAERIQVALLNVLEERDIQVRGYTLRLPLDLLVMASANPEDYTNRGRIITPMKDRFGAEITTHYPYDVQHEVDLIAQEADLVAIVPMHMLEIVARFTRLVRESGAVDQRSGVSARFAIAATEALAGAALRRSAITGDEAVARIGDLTGVVPSLRGKVEFEVSEEGREEDVLQHLARKATAEVFRRHLGGVDLTPLIAVLDEGGVIEIGDLVTSTELLEEVGAWEGLGRLVAAVEGPDAEPTAGIAAAAVELALEGLWLTRRIDKDESEGRTRFAATSTD